MNRPSFSTLISDKLENESFRRVIMTAQSEFIGESRHLSRKGVELLQLKLCLVRYDFFSRRSRFGGGGLIKMGFRRLGNWKLIWINVSVGRDPISGRAKFLKRELVRVISTGKILYKDRRVRKIVRALAVVVNWERDIITPMYPCQAI